MIVELNGSPVEFAGETTVADAVERAGAAASRRGVAVAVNGEVIPRSEWERTALREGQRVEVVRAVQGG